jgi:hypothetical protein
MNADIGRFTRILHAIGAVEGADAQSQGGQELGKTYNRLREEVRSSLPESLYEEFDRLHRPFEESKNRTRLTPEGIIAEREATSVAKTRLTALYGWLEGHLAYEREIQARD